MALMSLNKALQQQLLELARNAIGYGLQHGKSMPIESSDYSEDLQELRASFVTLEIKHQLRGCIGMLEAVRPLAIDIVENAYSAAFKDPRFPPLKQSEFPELDIHLSILEPSVPMNFDSETDLISQLRPGIDGLILQEGGRRGTFLPSVWESLPDPNDFLRHLKLKAGLPVDYWSDNVKVSRYQCQIIS